MDSVTQIALGATVAEVTIGKKAGNKAILWGAVFGTLPDLDVTLGVFFDQVQMLGIHRGLSHSILFSVLAAPLFGLFLQKFHRKTDISFIKWSIAVFLILITHIFLDACTVYGTQLFKPFSNYPVGINSIFIIDPVYTLPMFLGLLITLFIKNKKLRWKINVSTLSFSTIYLIISIIIKFYSQSIFIDNLNEKDIKYDKIITMASPINIVMFNGMAICDDKLYVGTYSIFDNDKIINFQLINRNSQLIDKYKNSKPVRKLNWFSKGFYSIRIKDGNLYYSDLRFGRSDFWMEEDGQYVFNYKLIMENDKVVSFDRQTPKLEFQDGQFRRFLNRVNGVEN